MIEVTLPDGRKVPFEKGQTIADITQSIGAGLAKAALAARFDEQLVDLSFQPQKSGQLTIITDQNDEALEIIRHSTAHLMAQAVKELFPKAQVTIGPAIETGFYYDFDHELAFNESDLEKIEQKMTQLARQNLPIMRQQLSKVEAIELFSKLGEHYKVEIIREIKDDMVSLYSQGDFLDLCRGPHVPKTGKLQAFKLLNVAGAYWRGNENNKMLQRIYGTAFGDKKSLKQYLLQLEEAKKRDHRKLGKQLDLFSFHQEAPASPFFHAKGAFIYNSLIDFIRQFYREYDYQEVITPQILDVSLWHKSGHYANYQENMYFSEVEQKQLAVKPMNCPLHVMIYQSGLRSYRDLPIRLADFGRLHRYEKSGALAGLFRVRTFAQDDGHIFCTPDQIEEEIKTIIDMLFRVYQTFGFDKVLINLSTRPDKSIGSDAMWQRAESSLEQALMAQKLEYKINPGDGAFYGPKIDFKVLDAIGRQWQLGTIQLDFSMPDRFGISYADSDGQEKTPVMIHRALLGSVERFMGILIEHYAGRFPVWLAPEQIRVIAVAETFQEYADQVSKRLKSAGLRIHNDRSNEKMGYKIRQAQLQKIPYMLILGQKELDGQTVSMRMLSGEQHNDLSLEATISSIQERINQRSL